MRFLLPLLLAAGALPLAAQDPVVRGIVRGPTGDPLPYSVVELRPEGRQRFTDDSGRFVFSDVAAGSHTLRARRLGYTPRDTTIGADAAGSPLELRLARLTVSLAEVHVVGTKGCRHPGPPDPVADPTLASIFDQMRENADRWLLLAAQYPFVASIERKVVVRRVDGTTATSRLDTLVVEVGARWRYAPGRVVSPSPGPNGMERQLNLPGLPDLADTTFHRAHCFAYGGTDRVKGRDYVRIDFRAADTLSAPDIDGSVYLDTDGFQLRRATITVTQPAGVDPSIRELRATTTYREIVPAVVVLESVEGTTAYWDQGPTSNAQRIDKQRTLAIHWQGATPPGSTPP